LPTACYQQYFTIINIIFSAFCQYCQQYLSAAFYKQHFITSIFLIPYCENHLQAAFYQTSLFLVPLHQQHFANSILPSYFCYCCAIILQVLSALYQYFASIASIILSGELYKQHFFSSILLVAFAINIFPAEC